MGSLKMRAEDDIYENMFKPAILQTSLRKGNPPESSPKRARILHAVLVALSLLLLAALVFITVTYLQERQEKRRVAEAVQGIRDFWKENGTLNTLVLEQMGRQLVGEVQLLRGLWEEVVAPCAVMRNQHRDILTRLSQGWRFHSGNLYYFSQENNTWREAEGSCVAQHAHLSSVLSQEEQEYLVKETRGIHHWIGLADLGVTGTWRWTDGSVYTNGFWNTGQPDNWHQNIGGAEECVHLKSKSLHSWNDGNCTRRYRWVCKKALG
ncbi:C-type lectin domain family 4 member F [Alligator mississippiensis]|uniref:C-type lectin domain family 4 member F-like n=1 Tax=Alligator mississippiensis TaxID=8496 RepID=A0A151MP34_ALLMI|nr:C-type lectin domain family 4 member F [Alligator mississippiensis]KYO26284.1 C-type lectin domain family 4 member F-like [Alligator mississippiensis]